MNIDPHEIERGNEIAALVADFPVKANAAIQAVHQLRDIVTRFDQLYDVELAETSASADADYELARAMTALRHVERIALDRARIEREWAEKVAKQDASDALPHPQGGCA